MRVAYEGRWYQICIDEKSDKIARHHQKYPKWQLILVDQSNLGIDVEDIDSISTNIRIPELWDRVILVDPSAPHIGHAINRKA